MQRLETLAPEFARRLQTLGAEEQRAVAVAASELALSRSGVDHPVIAAIEPALQGGAPVSSEERERIRALADQLDEIYFDLQEAAEAHGAEASDWEQAFRRARAVSSLYWALDDDPLTAASEAVYESAAAVGDPADVLAAVDLVFQQ